MRARATAATALQKCLLKITVDGTELAPAAGADAFFDNNDLGVGSPNHLTDDTFSAKSSGDSAQHAIVRVSGNLSAGAHVGAGAVRDDERDGGVQRGRLGARRPAHQGLVAISSISGSASALPGVQSMTTPTMTRQTFPFRRKKSVTARPGRNFPT